MEIEIGGYRPGALAAIVGLHARYYAQHWSFGLPVETKVGADLLGRALKFCDERGYARIWLTTFAGLDAARSLYERFGFALAGETESDQWSGDVREQVFERRMPTLPFR